MTRRHFGKAAAGLIGAASVVRAADDGAVPTVYFVDGYHGGAIGHMPAGSWRDILNTLRDLPQWKVSLDIEPISWDLLRRQDPDAYAEWKRLLNGKRVIDSRVEMVGFTFAQPYGWAIGGESNIRQLVRGKQVVLRHFPETAVFTYAVQEPCWASCLPQILLSLGFSAAVLKDPGTAWGGYAAGLDAETAKWKGPDGSMIATVNTADSGGPQSGESVNVVWFQFDPQGQVVRKSLGGQQRIEAVQRLGQQWLMAGFNLADIVTDVG